MYDDSIARRTASDVIFFVSFTKIGPICMLTTLPYPIPAAQKAQKSGRKTLQLGR